MAKQRSHDDSADDSASENNLTPTPGSPEEAAAKAQPKAAKEEVDPLVGVSRRYAETDTAINGITTKLEAARRNVAELEKQLDQMRKTRDDIRSQLRESANQ